MPWPRLAVRSLGWIGAGMVLLAGAGHAQYSPLPSVRGVVKIRGQATLTERVEVALLTTDGRPREKVFADSLGNFQFVGLAQGAYILVIDHPGYRRIEQRVEVTGGVVARTFTQRDFVLVPLASEPTLPGAVSAERVRVDRKAVEAVEKGERELLRRQYQKAAGHYERALAIAPGFSEALDGRGLVALQQNQPAEARQYFAKAVAANARNAVAQIHLGVVLVRQGEAQAALDPLNKGLLLHPKSYLGLFERCRAHLALNQLAAAVSDCQDARAVADGPRPELSILMGNVFLRANRREEALREFEDYLRRDPQGPAAAQVRARVQSLRDAGVKPRS